MYTGLLRRRFCGGVILGFCKLGYSSALMSLLGGYTSLPNSRVPQSRACERKWWVASPSGRLTSEACHGRVYKVVLSWEPFNPATIPIFMSCR